MRNLKKILALVLALVMSMSLVTISSAAFTDQSSLNAKYNEAVKVLNGLGVFQGYDDGSFNPKGTITRAEVAAIIYRVVTGDVDDSNVELYADYNKFDDVKSGSWYAPYVNYCANAEYIKGFDAKTFKPNEKVTGYQALAMILRAIGYDKMGEFTGTEWKKHTAQVANTLGITSTIGGDTTLGADATREVVAEILFRTIAYAPQVTYTLALGYNDKDSIVFGRENPTLGEEVFQLHKSSTLEVDKWGRPGYIWYQELTGFNTNSFYIDDDDDYGAGDEYSAVYASFADPYINSYNVATANCEIAVDHGYGRTYTIPLWDNGIANNVTIVPTDLVANERQEGGQGVLLEIYEDRIVRIDTYLAQVGTVYPEQKDINGHIIRNAYSDLTVFGGAHPAAATAEYAGLRVYTNEYRTGDMILVNIPQTYTQTSSVNTIDHLGVAPSFEGTQSTIWFNADKHTVNNTDYNDAYHFHLDQAQYDTTKHLWYQDQYGNLIGVTDYTNYSYGVLNNLYWVNDVTNISTGGAAYGEIVYMDGTSSGIVQIVGIDGLPTTYARQTHVGAGDSNGDSVNDSFFVSTYARDNASLLRNDLYKVDVRSDGSVMLNRCYETNGSIYTGVSKVADTVDNLYADNFTQYLIYDNYEFKTVTGFDNIGNYENIDIHYLKTANDFMRYVFINGSEVDDTGYEFVFVTNNGRYAPLYSNNAYQFVLSGVIRPDGSTDPVIVDAYANGTPALTESYLRTWTTGAIGNLFRIYTVNGVVQDIDHIDDVTIAAISGSGNLVAEHEGRVDRFYTDGSGVLVVDGKHYNVNSATTIITENGIGSTADLSAAVVNGKFVFVVYYSWQPTTAAAVFVTNQPGKPAPGDDRTPLEIAIENLQDAIAKLNAAIRAAQDIYGYTPAAAASTYAAKHIAAYEALYEARMAVEKAASVLNDLYYGIEDTATQTMVHNLLTQAYTVVGTAETASERVLIAAIDVLVKAYAEAEADGDTKEVEAIEEEMKDLHVIIDSDEAHGDELIDKLDPDKYDDFIDLNDEADADAIADAKANAVTELKEQALAAFEVKYSDEEKYGDSLVYIIWNDTTLKEALEAGYKVHEEAFTTALKNDDLKVADVEALIAKYVPIVADEMWNHMLNHPLTQAKKEAITWIEMSKSLYYSEAEWAIVSAAQKNALASVYAATTQNELEMAKQTYADVIFEIAETDILRDPIEVTNVANGRLVLNEIAERVANEFAITVTAVQTYTDKAVYTVTLEWGESEITHDVTITVLEAAE